MQRSPQAHAWLVSLMAVSIVSLFANAQTLSEYQVKAAYLYNFAKFVEWPERYFAGPSASFQFCVLQDELLQAELTQFVRGKTVVGRSVSVVGVPNVYRARACQILFIGSSQEKKSRQVLDALKDTGVLTVGEASGFVDEGGIINFVMLDDRIHFQVNHKAANAAGLRISSRLLSVAQRVIE